MTHVGNRIPAWLGRNVLRLVIYAGLILTLAGVSLWFAPFSSDAVNRKIKESFFKATGLDLQFDALVFYLAQEKITVRDLMIVEPDSKAVLTGATRLEADLQIDWRRRDIAKIHSIQIQKPHPLVFLRTDKGIVPGPELARLAEARPPQKAGSAAGQSLSVDTISLDEGSIVVRDAASKESLAQIEEAKIIGSWSGSEEFDFMAEGSLKALDAEQYTHWRGKISRLPESPAFHFFTQFDELIGKSQFKIDLPIAISGKNVSIGGEFHPEHGGQAFGANLQLSGESLLLEDIKSGRNLSASKVHLRTRSTFDPASKVLDLDETELSALGLEAAGDLTLELKEPYEYSAVVNRFLLPQQTVQRLQKFIPSIQQVIDYRDGSILIQGIASGVLTEKAPEMLEGSITLTNVDVAVPALALPLQDLNGNLYFDGSTVSSENIAGSFGKSHLRLGGQLESDDFNGLLAGKPNRLNLKWHLDGQGEDLVAMLTHADISAIEGLTVSGSVVTSGTLTTDFGTSPTLETAGQNLHIAGTGVLRNFSLNDPRLPGAIENVSGRFDVSNRSIELVDMQGTHMRSSATLSGSVKGEPYFWSRPEADLQVQTQLDLARVASELRPRFEDKFELPPLKGEASAELRLTGRLDNLSSLIYTGKLTLDDVQTTLDYPVAHGTLRNMSGEIELEENLVRFNDVNFSIQDIKYNLSGDCSRADLKAKVQFSGPLEQIKAAQSPLFDFYEVGGRAEFRDTVHIALPQPERRKALADKRFPPVLAFIDGMKSVDARSFDTTNTLSKLMSAQDGRWVFRDATFTHLSFPTPVHRINGTVTLVREGIRSENLNLYFGNDPARVAMKMFFNRDEHKAFEFDIRADRADLTAFYGKWKKLPPALRTTIAPGTKPRLKSVMNVKLQTGTTKIRKYDFTRHTADLVYENWRGGNKLLFLREVTGEGYGGRVKANGKLTFVRNGPVLWDTSVQASQINLDSFLSRRFNRAAFMSGRMDVTTTIKGRDTDKKSMNGAGSFEIHNPRFEKGNPVIMQILNMVKIFQLSDMVFRKAEGKFQIRDGFVHTDRVTMGNEVMELAARGRVGLDTTLDYEVYIKPLSAFQRIPLLNQPVDKLIDVVSSSLLKFHVRGTMKNPRVSPIPVATDRIDDLRGLFTW